MEKRQWQSDEGWPYPDSLDNDDMVVIDLRETASDPEPTRLTPTPYTQASVVPELDERGSGYQLGGFDEFASSNTDN